MPLVEADCRAAACPKEKEFKRFSDSGGLRLEVSRAGSKIWRWKYRIAGREKSLAIGLWPAVSLREARRTRDAARLQLASGIDPSAAKRAAAETSFESIARRWFADWSANKSPRHAGYVLRRLEADAFPAIGGRRPSELTAPDFVRMAKGIEVRGAEDIARRVLQSCRQAMRYAVAHGLAERNPVADVKPSDVLRTRRGTNYARISTDELPELLRAIDAYKGSPFTRLGMRLMLLTFVRTGELIGARWTEFDLEKAEWRIPAERTKSRRVHWVPLSRQSIEVLRTLGQVGIGEFVIPGERSGRPISNNTILKALERMGYKGRMTGHGFRGVASTILNEMGFRPDVIEAQLAHVEVSRVRAAYNYAQYREERRRMMQRWADHCDEIRR